MGRGMTHEEAIELWRSDVLPGVRAEFEADGVPDYPARRESWNNWVWDMYESGSISDTSYENWEHPEENTAPWDKE